MELHEINIEPPEIKEIVSNQVVSDACIGKQLCVLAFLPNILDNGGKWFDAIIDPVFAVQDFAGLIIV